MRNMCDSGTKCKELYFRRKETMLRGATKPKQIRAPSSWILIQIYQNLYL